MLTLEGCRTGDELFSRLVKDSARWHGVEPRALAVRTLLQLPRVASRRGRVLRRDLDVELRSCALQLRADQAMVFDLASTDAYPLDVLRFVECEVEDAEAIFGNLHYLRSARPGARNFALIDPIHRRPVTLCSVSPMDWAVVGKQLNRQFGVAVERMWDVSRVYSFDVAPANAISTLLAGVRKEMQKSEPTAELLTTVVDQNLGFTGSSYRAANWQYWMSVRPRPYLYVDGVAVSPRQLGIRYGTQSLAEVRAKYGVLAEQSRAELADSMIYCCRLRGPTEAVEPGERRRLRRRSR
ncbi:Mom family adenine methylcarbamoylation protein [Kribbella endophytica]